MTATGRQRNSLGAAGLNELMRRSQQGDADAYRLLLTRMAPRLRRMIVLRAPWLGREDVEDVVQDILLSLHLSRHAWDPDRPFLPWIATIARSRLADHARRHARRTAINIAASDLAETFCDPTTNKDAEVVVNLMSMRKAMLDLSPAEKQAVDHLRLRELSLHQAAQTTGSTVPALKVAIHRAMRKMKSVLWKD